MWSSLRSATGSGIAIQGSFPSTQTSPTSKLNWRCLPGNHTFTEAAATVYANLEAHDGFYDCHQCFVNLKLRGSSTWVFDRDGRPWRQLTSPLEQYWYGMAKEESRGDLGYRNEDDRTFTKLPFTTTEDGWTRIYEVTVGNDRYSVSENHLWRNCFLHTDPVWPDHYWRQPGCPMLAWRLTPLTEEEELERVTRIAKAENRHGVNLKPGPNDARWVEILRTRGMKG